MMIGAGFSSKGENSAEINSIIRDIQQADKVDDLYTSRMNLKRIPVSQDITAGELKQWYTAYENLAEGFKRRNHYRNAVESYRLYLKYKEQFLVMNTQQAIDSVISSHQSIIKSETTRILSLEKEITDLESNHAKVVSLRSAYQLWGSIISVILIIGFGYFIIKKNKTISTSQKLITNNRKHVMELSTKLVEASMIDGGNSLITNCSAEAIVDFEDLFLESSDQRTEEVEKVLISLKEFSKDN